MNDKQMIKFGRVFKAMGMEAFPKIIMPEDNIRVSMLHHVKPGDLDNLDSIINYLSKVRRIISPDEFFSYYTDGSDSKISGKSLLLTFDDGLYSSYWAAKTVLAKYGIKAIFFVPTEIFSLRNKENMRKFVYHNVYSGQFQAEPLTEAEYVTMSKENVVSLRRSGHWVLPHTHSHCRISGIVNEEMVSLELLRPKSILEDVLGEEIQAFALPRGTERDINAFSYRQMTTIYKFCFSALTGVNHEKTNHHYFHRDCIHAHYPVAHVRNIIAGVFDAYYFLKMSKMKARVKRRKIKSNSNRDKDE